MELKEYQIEALEKLDSWFAELEKQRHARQNADHIPQEYRADYLDYPKHAWKKLSAVGKVADRLRPYAQRSDGMDRPIPHVCFKVPTGGGKTLLAAEALGRIQYPRGLVLWIVPTNAIYRQTKDALWNREHPYRQRLERASGGRVKVLEKDDRIQPADIANYLCVMLLSFHAANRQNNKEFLKMFRDSGRYHEFFPGSDDALFGSRLLQKYPDLERSNNGKGPILQSLCNVIKMQRPVIILDEAHKAYGKKSAEHYAASINRFNPCLALEFSATPNANISNLLVDITGVALKAEEMIKMPVQVTSQMQANWQDTLSAAEGELTKIDAAAQRLHQQEDRYIRPIAVVRVERTGRDQRDGIRVHAEDVREYLERNMGVAPEAIRVKSSSDDELGREDLLSETSAVRWIITRAALMEGWDCPFAYLLVLLDNTRSQTALTQLVGRILRQPHARLTGVEALDRCYVYCWNLDVMRAVEQVRQGLKDEGLGDLTDQVNSLEGEDPALRKVSIQRREAYRDIDISIPKVLHRHRGGWRKLDHLQDILAEVQWDEVELPPVQIGHEPPTMQRAEVDVDEERAHYADEEDLAIDKTLRLSWFARRLSDVVPNPWRAAQFVLGLFDQLKQLGLSESDIFDNRAGYAQELRANLREQRDRLSKAIFEQKLNDGLIRFDLYTEPSHQLPDEIPLLIGDRDHTLERGGEPVQLSLFDRVFEKQFDSKLEEDFAFHLEKQPLHWWHRVQREYYVLGWRRERIYPDFVTFADRHFGMFETKGDHLRHAEDTQYKREVFALLEKHFNSGDSGVRIEERQDHKGMFEIVYDSNFPAIPN